MKDKPLLNCIVENCKLEDDIFTNVTIYNAPESLLREFMRTVVGPNYPEGISGAIQNLIRRETLRQKKIDAIPDAIEKT
jgi:hypothetical protein